MLRDDGVSYGDYLEQLTDEYGRPPHSRDVGIPPAYDWQSLKKVGLAWNYVAVHLSGAGASSRHCARPGGPANSPSPRSCSRDGNGHGVRWR